MANYQIVIFYSLIGGMFSLVGGVLVLSHKKLAEGLAAYATPFAAGALLSAVFLDLLKDGLEVASADIVLMSCLIGVVAFFFAERFLHWFHHHHQHGNQHDPTVSLIIIGDSVHNALDGVAIASAFLISVPTGIVTTMAVAAHEIPQEVSDFGLLLARGLSRTKALWSNVFSSLLTTLMAVITFAVGNNHSLPVGILIGVSAGFLLYIATSDIIPQIHEQATNKRLLEWQPVLLLVGVLTVALSIQLAHYWVV